MQSRYGALVDQVLGRARSIYQGLVQAGSMEATAEQLERLVQNSWIVTVYWFTFLETRGGRDTISQEDGREGVLQLVALFYPYLTASAQQFMDRIVGSALQRPSSP